MTIPPEDGRLAPVTVEYVDIDSVQPHPRNPNQGDVGAIDESIEENGVFRSIVAQRSTGYILDGNHTWRAHKHRGTNPIPVTFRDVDDVTAVKILLAANRTAQRATYDDSALLTLLKATEQAAGLEGTGWDTDDLDALAHDSGAFDAERDAEYAAGHDTIARARTMPLDLIFSLQDASSGVALCAYAMGWHPGIITTAATAARSYRDRYPRGKRIMFMDNEWHDYDHAAHVDTLAEFTPKYGTVRDLVTRAQAEEAGVEHYDVDETLRMAEEVAQHVERVILIPKWDCLEHLPRTIGGKQVVLGYSVHSSYGGTDMPPSKFRGWPVHLLGGSWKKQRAILNVLGDDVVSLDNNNVFNIGRFANYNEPAGTTANLAETFNLPESASGLMVPSVVMSLALIAHEIRTAYAVTLDDDLDAIAAAAESTTDRDA